MNGEGKTTITKLLTGLYDTYDGQIYINGKDLKEYRQATIKSIFSVIYQDFAKYQLTIKDNILLGGMGHNEDEEKRLDSLDKSDLTELLKDLPVGLKTPLGRLFSLSTELSGGQWQRVAIARTIYRNHCFIVLDEPTAAIDPIEEAYIFEQFKKLTEKHTALIVTHCLASAKCVDEIIVLDKGTVVEKGSHDQLMRDKGVYYKMFKAQEHWYK